MRAALRPRWLIGHVIVILMICGFVWAGFWQVRRLSERNAENARIEARTMAPVVPYDELVVEVTADPGDVEFRRVEITGTYTDGEVLIRGRSLNQTNGYLVVTPLVSDSATVLVARGWVPFAMGNGAPRPLAAAAPPSGEVTVVGYLRQSETRGLLGGNDPVDGVLDEMNRIDVARIDEQTAGELAPMWIQLQSQVPEGGEYPAVIPPPKPKDGNHLSYAFQWFSFAVVAAVAWPLIVSRSVRKRRSRPASAERPDAPGAPDSIDAPTGA